jgi:hypothetical protein
MQLAFEFISTYLQLQVLVQRTNAGHFQALVLFDSKKIYENVLCAHTRHLSEAERNKRIRNQHGEDERKSG